MLDFDLAELYEVETKVLNQAVKRNIERFPTKFRFQITQNEKNELVTNCDRLQNLKHSSTLPFVFTEQGVAMLSAILRSKIAISVSIAIMNAFVELRHFIVSNSELSFKLKELEIKYDKQFSDIFEALNYLLQKDTIEKEQKERRAIGYGR